MSNKFLDGLHISPSGRARDLARSCDDLLNYIESENLVARADEKRIPEQSLEKIRGVLVLAHDYIKGVASDEAVAQVGKELATIDVGSKGVLAAAGGIMSMVAKAFGRQAIPDTSEIIPDIFPHFMDGKRLFTILYGAGPTNIPKPPALRAQIAPSTRPLGPLAPHHS